MTPASTIMSSASRTPLPSPPNLLHEARVSIDFRGEIDVPNSTRPPGAGCRGLHGGGGATIGSQRLHQIRTEWDDDFIYTGGKQSLKAGLQLFDYVERPGPDHQLQRAPTSSAAAARPCSTPTTTRPPVTTTITGIEQYRRALLSLPGGTPTQYSSVAGTPEVDFTEFYPAFFVQDDIKLRPGLSLSAGLRYFYANLPFQDNGFTPRFGVSWAPGGSKTLTLKAHLGLFSGHSPNGLQATQAELQREDGTRTRHLTGL